MLQYQFPKGTDSTLIMINSQTMYHQHVIWRRHISLNRDSSSYISMLLNGGTVSSKASCPICDGPVRCPIEGLSPILSELCIGWYSKTRPQDSLPWLPARLPWQYPGTWFQNECVVQSPTQNYGMVASKWGVQWSIGTNRSLRKPWCQVEIIVLGRKPCYWTPVFLHMKVRLSHSSLTSLTFLASTASGPLLLGMVCMLGLS